MNSVEQASISTPFPADATPGSTAAPLQSRAAVFAMWGLVAIAAILAVALPFLSVSASAPVMLALIPFTLIHGSHRYGWRILGFYLVETLVVTFGFENLSIATGFPFGHYHYTGNLRIGEVPLIVGAFYCALGYVSWLVASTLLDVADLRLGNGPAFARRINLVALPMVAAALMTIFDVGSDSVASTLQHVWVWENGGGVFGVPYTNYLGWWFVTYCFFQIFALGLANAPRRDKVPPEGKQREALAQGVALYAILGLMSITSYRVETGKAIVDATGVVWNSKAILETMMTFSIFGVVFAAFVAAVKLVRNDIGRRAG